uniref:Uncharacterized protein n=1 Tax=Rhipicephalus microplus TaxID=6941 RepID=A0A6G5AJB4_RHIMP
MRASLRQNGVRAMLAMCKNFATCIGMPSIALLDSEWPDFERGVMTLQTCIFLLWAFVARACSLLTSSPYLHVSFEWSTQLTVSARVVTFPVSFVFCAFSN